MDKTFALAGAISAFIAVGAGAFGAHALRGRITPDLLAVFETGARYQMYHALALFAVAWASNHWTGSPVRVAGWLFIGGGVVFSGRLYFLSLPGPPLPRPPPPFRGIMVFPRRGAPAVAVTRRGG